MVQTKNHPFSTALFLARRDELMNVDRALLRGHGVRQSHFLSSGRAGLEFLRRRTEPPAGSGRPHLVVCDLHLADMTGLDFIRGLRALPGFENTPVLLLASALPGAAVGTLGRMGRAGILCRPYTQADLANTLEFLSVQNTSGPMVTASPLATRALERARRPVAAAKQNALALGLALLDKGAFANAHSAFKEALRMKPYRAAAFRGLSLAAAGLGDMRRAYRLMRTSARFFIMDEDFYNARRALMQSARMAEKALLLPEEAAKNAGNPLYRAGCALIRAERYESAARALLNGMAYTPNISPVNAVKRACAATGNEYHAAESLCAHLAACGGVHAGAALRRILMPPQLEEKPSRLGFLGDMVAMARNTYRMYRAGAL